MRLNIGDEREESSAANVALGGILNDRVCIQAGAYLQEIFRRRPGAIVDASSLTRRLKNPLSDVPAPPWPIHGNLDSLSILRRFVKAGLLEDLPGPRFRQTETGRVLLPCFPLMHFQQQEHLADRIPGLVAAVRNRRVLDLGCGVGLYANLLHRLGAQSVMALDHLPRVLQVGSRLASSTGTEVAWLLASAEAIPLGDGAVDLVFCRLAFCYVHAERTMAEVSRILAPGGCALFMVHSPRYYLREILRAGWGTDRMKLCAVGFLGLAGGLVFDLFQCRVRWWFPGRRFYESYDRKTTFDALARRHGLRLVWWEAGSIKPYAVVSKPGT